jgi:hypothetical protein
MGRGSQSLVNRRKAPTRSGPVVRDRLVEEANREPA